MVNLHELLSASIDANLSQEEKKSTRQCITDFVHSTPLQKPVHIQRQERLQTKKAITSVVYEVDTKPTSAWSSFDFFLRPLFQIPAIAILLLGFFTMTQQQEQQFYAPTQTDDVLTDAQAPRTEKIVSPPSPIEEQLVEKNNDESVFGSPQKTDITEIQNTNDIDSTSQNETEPKLRIINNHVYIIKPPTDTPPEIEEQSGGAGTAQENVTENSTNPAVLEETAPAPSANPSTEPSTNKMDTPPSQETQPFSTEHQLNDATTTQRDAESMNNSIEYIVPAEEVEASQADTAIIGSGTTMSSPPPTEEKEEYTNTGATIQMTTPEETEQMINTNEIPNEQNTAETQETMEEK